MSFAPAVAPSRFRMEDALQATFGSVAANFVVFATLAAALYAAPNLLAQLVFPGTLLQAGASGLVVAGVIIKPLVGLISFGLLQGALTRGVIVHMNGEKPRFADCLRTSLVHAAPLVAIGLIFWIAVVVGMVFLLAPGLFLVALWTPAGAVRVAERRGVFAAFSRAAELTEGSRWAVLIVMVVVTIVAGVANAALMALLGLVVGGPLGMAGAALAGAAGGPLTPLVVVFVAISTLSAALVSLLTNAAPAAVYWGLRQAREGAGPSELAALFD